MASVRLGEGGKLKLPPAAIRKLRLKKGEQLGVHVVGEVVMLVPAGRIPKGQRYFWTAEWQRREQEADEAIARGELLGPFEHVDDAIRALRTARE